MAAPKLLFTSRRIKCKLAMCILLMWIASQPKVAAQITRSVQQKFEQYRSTKASTPDHPYWVAILPTADCKAISNFKIVRELGNGLAIVRLVSTETTVTKGCFSAIAPANDEWKLSPALELYFRQTPLPKGIATITIVATQLDSLFASFRLKKIAFEILSSNRETQAATIRCSTSIFLKECLPDAALIFADLFTPPQPDVMVPGYRRSISGLQLAAFHFPQANGRGITIGIKENKPQETDIDVQKRIFSSPIAATTTDDHATTIATLAGGAGNSDYSGKGVAPGCRFFPSSFSNLFADSNALLLQNEVSVQNHSYGTVIQSFYGAEALSYDAQAAQLPTILPIFSSGNQGTAAATTGTYTGIAGFVNLTGNFKMAKNVVTVAAVDTGGRLAAFSSAGPLYDGRLAPQITALGPNGTSEAAAIVSGAAAVLQQVYRDSNAGLLPPASLVKAVLYTTCDDVGNTGIDYRSGYGLLNVYRAIRCLQQKQYDGSSLAQGQGWTKNITLPAKAANLKLTLSWTDTAATVNNATALVNDLDLTLIEINTGTVYRPWVLSSIGAADSLRKQATRRRDSLNTSEQISIDLPAAGTWQVRVSGRKVSTFLPQAFSIAYAWDTLNILRFTSPVPPLENETLQQRIVDVRWAVALADTNATGNFSVSYNNGLSWRSIANGVALKNKLYHWLLPDTAAIAQLQMETAFGSFLSEKFVLAPPTVLHVDYLCQDSLRLSWNANRLTNAYRLFTLVDTAYMKPLLNIADTFVVLNRNVYNSSLYAVEFVLSNAPQAARSVAVDVRYQGSNCFYNTFFAQPSPDSIQLTIEVGYRAGLDSIVFEKVTAGGAFIKKLGKVLASTATSYSSWDAATVDGANYYRVAIWRSGRRVYTEIISIVHTGAAPLFVYPNPVRKGQPLHILLKETLGNNRLQLLDMTGRTVKQLLVAGSTTHHLDNLPAGLYLYRVLNAANAMIASGKLIVQ